MMSALTPVSIFVQPAAPPDLIVRQACSEAELAFCQEALAREHSLGEAQPAGRRLWQVVALAEDPAQPVAILLWAASAWHLKHRDAWIGWDGMVRSRRLGLIVNNSRLLILDAQRVPNLASKALGAALRALPQQWAEAFGYMPLLAEAFTDLESHAGTSYRASNWIALGETKGFARHAADFYVPNDRPKKLWIYALRPHAQAVLCAQELPPECVQGEIAPTVRSPLSTPQMGSLYDVFTQMTDPRSLGSRRYSLSLMLTLVCLGLLCGSTSLSAILRQAQLLSQVQRRMLGCRKKKGTSVYRVPCYNAFRDLLAMIDLEEMLRLLTVWLSQHEGHLPRTLALDGKDLGGKLGTIVSLVNTTVSSQGADRNHPYDNTPAPPVAMACGDGKGHELGISHDLLARPEVSLIGAVVTMDALHCQRAVLHQIVAQKGGDYFVSLKDNQPTAAAYAQQMLEGSAPLF